MKSFYCNGFWGQINFISFLKISVQQKVSTGSDGRRKWDKEEFERLARERIAEEIDDLDKDREVPVKRELLKPRDYRVSVMKV